MDKIKAWKFLENNHLGILATVSEENSPNATAIYYVTEDTFQLYFATSKDSKKYQNILKNNKVVLVVTEEPTKVLQIEGEARVIEDYAKKGFIIDHYLEIAKKSNPDYANWPPLLKLPNQNDFVFLEIIISQFKFSDFSESLSSITQGTPEDWQ